jgi:hypothetical protein
LQSDAVLELGKKIVDEFGRDRFTDTPSRWMAHYIAELIHDAEKTEKKERPHKQAKCAKAILTLWEHRYELPHGKRPFEDIEPILKTLETLDPTDVRARYFRQLRYSASEKDQTSETTQWLDVAEGIDYSARILIGYCLVLAAQAGLKKSKDWLEIAEAANADASLEQPVVRAFDEEKNLLAASEPTERQRKLLVERIERLEALKGFASKLASHMRQQLA